MTAKGQQILNMVLAVLVALGAWVFVVYNYKPMTNITYKDVPVTYTGEEALAERGLAVDDTDIDGITVVLNQKRADTSRISADSIKVTADLSECVAGDNMVTLNVSGPLDTTVMDYDKSSVEVTVGRAKSAEMDINVAYSGTPEEDAEPVAFDLSNGVANVTCTADRMADIDRIVAQLDPEALGDKVKSYTVHLAALDSEGNEINHVLIDPDEISLDAFAGYTKEVSLTIPVKTTTEDGYERNYVLPETLVIKGLRDDIANIGTVRAQEVDISEMTENGEVPIEYNLPDGIYVADESRGQTVKVTVVKKDSDDDE